MPESRGVRPLHPVAAALEEPRSGIDRFLGLFSDVRAGELLAVQSAIKSPSQPVPLPEPGLRLEPGLALRSARLWQPAARLSRYRRL